MPDRIAIKRLTESDLTFFESQFRLRDNVRQKAINLNRNVFVDLLYPALREDAAPREMAVRLVIHGPGEVEPYRLARSITKTTGAYKNWRLNGEFVHDPEGEVGRFDSLAPDDLAILEFGGDPHPDSMTLVLIAAGLDPDLHRVLSHLVPQGRQSMAEMTREQLAELADAVAASRDHPVRRLARDLQLELDIQDAAVGDPSAAERVRRKSGGPVTAETLAAARAAADAIGADGEAVAMAHLQKLMDQGVINRLIWSSQTNATCAWDFELVLPNGQSVRIDAKSTRGGFDRPLHISIAELEAATAEGHRYDLWRVFELDESGAKLRIAEDVRTFARSILESLKLPGGVRAQGFAVDPIAVGAWGDSLLIQRPDEPD